MYQYDTVSEAINDLKERGYTTDFNISNECIVCEEKPLRLSPSEFEITEVYRFEGPSDPADEAVVYAIESKHGDKGVMVNGYGASTDGLSDEMIRKIAIK